MTEAMIAMAIIGVTVVLIPHFLALYNPRGLSVKRTCESYAQSIISVVQEENTYRNIVQQLDSDLNRGITSPSFPITPRSMTGPGAADYWTPLANYIVTDSPLMGQEFRGTSLNNAGLIQGNLRSLAAIYNQNAAVQCAFGNYPPLTANLPVPALMGTYNPAVSINIEPYRISTNAPLCTASFKLAAPRSSSTAANRNVFITGSGVADNISTIEPIPAPASVMAGYNIATISNADSDLGFRLRVKIDYTVEGNPLTCEVAQKFEYPMDNTPPAAPTVQITDNESLNPTQLNCPNPVALNPRRVVLQIGYTVAPERGTVLLCRDLSYIQGRMPRDNDATAYSGSCVARNGAPPAKLPVPNFLHPFPRLAEPPLGGLREWDPSQRDFTSRDNVWIPCDKLKLCGVSATTASSTYGTTTMTLQYDTVPVGCILNVQAVGVDTAGNRSVASTFSTTAITEGNIVFPPTCGNSTTCTNTNGTCTSVGKNFYYGVDNGYYIPRRGVFCKATSDPANDGNLGAMLSEPNATLYWSTNMDGTPAATNWRTVFPNGYYTCREAFGGTGGATGSGSHGCCWDRPGSPATCTPYN